MQIGISLGLRPQFPRRSTLTLALLAGTSLSPLATFSRAGGATVVTSAGEVATVAANVPRWQHDPANTTAGPIGLTNHVRNPRFEGVPGEVPTNFTVVPTSGMARVLSVSTGQNGEPVWRVDMLGAPAAGGYFAILLEPTGGVPTVQGETWTLAFDVRLARGVSSATNYRARLQERGAPLSPASDSYITPTSEWQRLTVTRTMTEAGTTSIVPNILPYFDTAAGAVDMALEFRNVGLFKAASDPRATILPPPGYIGAWTEQRVVNYVPNARAEGGSASSFPTGFRHSGTTDGITAVPLGAVIEDGIPAFDVRFVGVATVTRSSANFGPCSTTEVAASAGQEWTAVMYVRKLAGDLPSGGSKLQLAEFGPGYRNGSAVTVAPSGAPLKDQRLAISRLLTDAATTNISPLIFLSYNQGESVDVTLRIGAPGLFKLGFDPGYTPLPPVGQPGRSGNLRPLGLLIEEQRSNLLLYSEGVDSAVAGGPWVTAGSTVRLGNVPGPDGKIIATSYRNTTTAGGVRYSIALPAGVQHTLSLWVRVPPSGIPLTRGNIVRFDASGAASVRLSAAGLQNDGVWRRLSITNTPADTATSSLLWLANDLDAGATVEIACAQLETGAYASSYIPTTSAAVTRLMDSVIAQGSALEALFSRREGTIVFVGTPAYLTHLARLFEMGRADTASSQGALAYVDSAGRYIAQVANPSVLAQAPSANGSIFAGVRSKLAVSWSNSSKVLALSLNGATPVVGAISADVPVATHLYIGNRQDGLRPYSGTISGTILHEQAFAGAALQALSA